MSDNSAFAGYVPDHTFNWGSEEFARQLKEVCLRGPRVLDRLAPTQEALNRFIGPHLHISQKVDIEVMISPTLAADKNFMTWFNKGDALQFRAPPDSSKFC